MNEWKVTQRIGLLLAALACFMLFRHEAGAMSLLAISGALIVIPFFALKNYIMLAVSCAAISVFAFLWWNGRPAASAAVGNAASRQVANAPNKPADSGVAADAGGGLKLLSPQTPSSITIPLHNPIDFDGKTRDEVLSLRRNAVHEQPALVTDSYVPNMNVYGGITDGKPWWGLTGTYFYGAGAHAADGLSEESRFLLNPYILVGLSEIYAFHLGANPPSEAQAFWPEPGKLVWHPAKKEAYLTYSLAQYFSLMKYRCPQCVDKAMNLFLATINAQDLGFTHMVIAPSPQVSAVFNTPFPLTQFIHTGGSCGISGGCNNSSPMSQNYVLHINSLPADVTFRLYDHAPANAQEPPQFTFHMKITE